MDKLLALVAGWKGYAAVALAFLLAGSGLTYKIMHNANLAGETTKAVATVHLVKAQDHITLNIGDIVVAGTIGAVTDTGRRQAEIPTHVTPQIDAAYPVPLGFVRVWNDASHGPIPGSTAGTDESPSGVPLSDVAAAHVADEGTLDICRVRLIGWQDWYTQQKSLSEHGK
jgi:hypothetical protein